MNNHLNAWITRGRPGNIRMEKTFFDENYYAVGWGKLGDVSNLNKEEILKLFTDYYNDIDITKNKLGMNASVLSYLANGIKKNDLLLMPDDEIIYIGIVSKEYYFNINNKDYPHSIDVNWKKSIKRNDLPLNLRNSLRAWQTIANLYHHLDTIKLLFEEDFKSQFEKLASSDEENMIIGNYPIRDNLNITYKIPNDMTKEEAERYGDFIKTLYFN